MAVAIRRLLLPLLALVLGLLALGYSALRYDESRTIQQSGLLAPVQAISNEKKIKRSGERITYGADIAYTTQDGRALTARTAISGQLLEDFRAGRPVQVAYLPQQPGTIRIVGEEDEGSSWLLVLFGAGALVYGGMALFLPGRRRR